MINETLMDTYTEAIPHTAISGYVVVPLTFSPFEQDSSISSNSTISNFQFNETSKKISFDVTGSDGTSGFANITFPKALLSGTLTVFLNGSQLVEGTDYTLTSTDTHHIIYLTYSHSSHEVEVVGTEAIPEMPTILILTLFMLGAGIVLIAINKRDIVNSSRVTI
jgi:hypothetical protein